MAGSKSGLLSGICGLLVTSLSMGAQAESQWFVAPFGGYSFAASELDANEIRNSNSNTVNTQLKIAESGHYGIMMGVKTKDPGDIYLLYSHQATDLRLGGNFSPDLLTQLDVDYLHVGGSLYFPKGNLRPYVTVSAGLTQMRPTGDYSNESRFSMGFGAGVEYQITDQFSLLADARGYATFVSSDNALFCDANQCIWNIRADIMWQGQVNAGIKFSF
ncbi:porin family protein [Shewanella mesophila]|uniref:outer membrane beta-barrel protein n=1 Tax=Shewanella mesophila TaxID=2864208 RepID=UPI001C654ACC|nr:outer membrane beta-barrel protein [Shewanella mesophila]QYJ85438.1 porin family protein [Shewanella mesophila]